MQKLYKILIVEPNIFLSTGLELILKNSDRFRTKVTTTTEFDQILTTVNFFTPDAILINPAILGANIYEYAKTASHCKIIAMTLGNMYTPLLKNYSGSISLEESSDVVLKQLLSIISEEEENGEEENNERILSPREKDVVIYVAKGYTNKQIAAFLNISIHTVITHRRNIAKKLKVHSSSGLTIYALANNLMTIEDVQK